MDGLTPEAQRLAAIVAVVVVLWFTEALPLAVTALLGATACVILGVAPAKEVFRPFADPIMFLFIGSFLLAEAIRIHRLDRRLAFAVLAVPWVGERPTRILAAIALVSAAISSFISNTVTAALMTTIVAGILHALEHAAPRDRPRPAAGFATGLFLSVAFAASIGGLATPVGTPTNLIGLGLIRRELDVAVTFAGWCAITLPVVAILLVVLVAVLGRLFPAGVDRLEGMRGFVAAERARLGPWSGCGGRPFVPSSARRAVLAALSSVAWVCEFDGDTPLDLIRAVEPDVLVKGADYAIHQVVGADIVLGRGGRVVTPLFVPDVSTTNIVERILASREPIP
jgi:sodium-dependent dicarboxylate transporter 2/3/5